MSVVRIKAGETEPRAHSGGGMDRVVEKKGLPQKVKLAIGAGLLVLAAGGFYAYAPTAESQTVAADRLTVSTVTSGRFDDFLPLRARVTPLVTVYLDAVEGGRVEKVVVEDGAMVSQGQLLAVMSNSDLQLSLLARQADVSREVNSMRSQELALSVTSMSDERSVIEASSPPTRRAAVREQKPLHERGFISSKAFNDSATNISRRCARSGSAPRPRHQSAAPDQSACAAARLQQLPGRQPRHCPPDAGLAQHPRAVTGQLTAFSIQVGQSMNRGERLGKSTAPGATSWSPGRRILPWARRAGQIASADWGGRSYRLKVAKIYPQVRNGTFEVDLQFIGAEPPELQRGQTLQTKLTLAIPPRLC
jgi:HlyD family secretion protein